MDEASTTPWTGERLGYLTTTGRRSGRPHTIEIWFAEHDGRLYILSGNQRRSDWIKNVVANPAVQLRAGQTTLSGSARLVSDPAEDALARRLLAAKYQGWSEGQPLSTWARTATPMRIDVAG
ncbi:MAG TPA: nitroreductase family deazaflavin-dependent oxidoreductase [Thermomicrobiaceae bacterium]|nr:nitroreductase family deazaflavin-dependent oxidoreductase [Thermomicrobiaceae bacterium]